MSHLGGWLSALVDGELDGMERDRALNHVAGCEACRHEANAMRALKRRLTALGDTCAESPIAGRLIELARSDQDCPAGVPGGPAPWQTASADPIAVRWAPASTPGWKVAAGSAGSALIAIGILAFLLGNGSGVPPVPKVTPPVGSFWLLHSYDVREPAAGTPGGPRDPAVGGRSRSLVSQVWLDPGGLGSGQAAQPAVTTSPVAAVSATVSPGPVASATVSPGAPSPSPGSTPGTRTATHSSK